MQFLLTAERRWDGTGDPKAVEPTSATPPDISFPVAGAELAVSLRGHMASPVLRKQLQQTEGWLEE